MTNTYHQVYLHSVFAVKYRNAVLHPQWRPDLLAVIGNLIDETHYTTIIVGGIEDRVHCFLGFKPSVSISELMKKAKSKSSKYNNGNKLTLDRFEWQEGHGVFSYSQHILMQFYKYIFYQDNHHQ